MIYYGSRINPRYLKRLNPEKDKIYLYQRETDDLGLLSNFNYVILGKLSLSFSFNNLFTIWSKRRNIIEGEGIYVFEMFTFLFTGYSLWKRTEVVEVGDLLHLNWPLSHLIGKIFVKIVQKNSIKLVVTSYGFHDYFKNLGVTKIEVIENIYKVQSLPKIEISEGIRRIGYIGMFRYLLNWNYVLDLAKCLDLEPVMYGQFLNDFDVLKYPYYSGSFDKSNLYEIYQKVDIVFCYYSGNNEKYLLPNKLHEAILFGKPIIFYANNFYSKLVKNFGLGVCLTGEKKTDEILIKDLVVNYEQYVYNISEYRMNNHKIYIDAG